MTLHFSKIFHKIYIIKKKNYFNTYKISIDVFVYKYSCALTPPLFLRLYSETSNKAVSMLHNTISVP